MNDHELTAIAFELDAAHERGRAAFARKDLAAYMELFAPELRFRQRDGVVISRDQLGRDVRDQFARIRVIRNEFQRDHIEHIGGRAIETIRQVAVAHASALVILHRTWDIQRKGRYAWKPTENGWIIEAVDILEEEISSRGIRIGFRQHYYN